MSLSSKGESIRTGSPTDYSTDLLVRGDVVMQGCWHHPQVSAETLRGGRVHTGLRLGGEEEVSGWPGCRHMLSEALPRIICRWVPTTLEPQSPCFYNSTIIMAFIVHV